MAINLRAKDLVEQRLPNLIEGPCKTKSDSTHNLEFLSTLGHWSKFESEVRQESLSVRWGSEVLAYAPSQEHNQPHHIYNEQLYCGDEHSVVARFGQNVGHVLTAVCRSLGTRIRFGDYKASSDTSLGEDIPDILVLNSSGTILIIGEAKTPWMHGIQTAILHPSNRFRHYLGQIAKYMYFGNAKYGFLTTYNETVFLKQGPHPDPRRRGKWVLWYSNVIHHTTKSQHLSPDDFKHPSRYHGKVSLRECLLFLVRKGASEGYHADNPMKFEDWVDALGQYRGDDSDDISDSSSQSSGSDGSSSQKSSTPRQSRASSQDPGNSPPKATSNRPVTRSRARAGDMAELETRTSQLAITSRSQQQRTASAPPESLVTVYYSDKRSTWYYLDRNMRAVSVELYEEQHEGSVRFYFKNGRDRRYVKKDKGKERRK